MKNGDLKQIRKWIKSVADEVKSIDNKLDNHLVTIGKDITGMKTDLIWLKKFFWVFVTPAIGAVIVAIYSLIIK